MKSTKLRMSIDPKLVERLDELAKKVSTNHLINERSIKLKMNASDYDGEPDGDLEHTFITFYAGFDGCWEVYRENTVPGKIFTANDENSWFIRKDERGMIRISTYGKMCVDINREIEHYLEDFEMEADLSENPVYCPICEHCGESGCCGFNGFLEKHVRGKTNCLYEDKILDDLEEFLRDKEVD